MSRISKSPNDEMRVEQGQELHEATLSKLRLERSAAEGEPHVDCGAGRPQMTGLGDVESGDCDGAAACLPQVMAADSGQGNNMRNSLLATASWF